MVNQNWSWHGVAGVILAATVGVGWAVALIITSLQAGPVTSEGAQILNTIGGGLIGSVATWLGLAGGKKPGDPDINQQTKTTTTTETAVHPADLDTSPLSGDDESDRKEQP